MSEASGAPPSPPDPAAFIRANTRLLSPPLVLSEAHADTILASLDAGFAAL